MDEKSDELADQAYGSVKSSVTSAWRYAAGYATQMFTEEDLEAEALLGKVDILWEGHKILRNLYLTFDCMYCSQKWGEDFAKFCGLLRIGIGTLWKETSSKGHKKIKKIIISNVQVIWKGHNNLKKNLPLVLTLLSKRQDILTMS